MGLACLPFSFLVYLHSAHNSSQSETNCPTSFAVHNLLHKNSISSCHTICLLAQVIFVWKCTFLLTVTMWKYHLLIFQLLVERDNIAVLFNIFCYIKYSRLTRFLCKFIHLLQNIHMFRYTPAIQISQDNISGNLYHNPQIQYENRSQFTFTALELYSRFDE